MILFSSCGTRFAISRKFAGSKSILQSEHLGCTSAFNEENTQDAHEAIRPTDISIVSISSKFTPREKKMYDFWTRKSRAFIFLSSVIFYKRKP